MHAHVLSLSDGTDNIRLDQSCGWCVSRTRETILYGNLLFQTCIWVIGVQHILNHTIHSAERNPAY